MVRQPEIPTPPEVRPAEDLAALSARINAAYEAGERTSRQGLDSARAVGEALLRAKARCGHGKWLRWVRENLPFSADTAANYMRVAREWDSVRAARNLREAIRLLTEGAQPDPGRTSPGP
jgi:hypothetical protein